MTAKSIAKQLKSCFDRGNKVLIFGNGGSAQMSNHFATELVHEGLSAISLTADPVLLTALSNDFSFKEVFARQIIANGKSGDIVIGLSTSGKSKNVLYAYKWAKKLGLEVIDFPRKGKNTPEIQEFQLHLLHKIWLLLKP